MNNFAMVCYCGVTDLELVDRHEARQNALLQASALQNEQKK